MQGQLSTNCDPRERLGPEIGPGGAWLMGPGCGISVCDIAVFFCVLIQKLLWLYRRVRSWQPCDGYVSQVPEDQKHQD